MKRREVIRRAASGVGPAWIGSKPPGRCAWGREMAGHSGLSKRKFPPKSSGCECPVKTGRVPGISHIHRGFGRMLRLSAAACLWAAFAFALATHAQSPSKNQPAELVYKNIQVFKGLPSTKLMDNMFYMEGALGVGCKECHVNFTDFEKDDNPHKQTARRMIQMVRDLNKDSFDGQDAITCNTCHRGKAVPEAPLAFAAIQNSSAARAAASAPAAPSRTVDQIFERYLAATGAASAGENPAVTQLTGSMLSSEGWVAPLKMYIGPAGKFLVVFDVGWISYTAFDGARGWSQDNNGLFDVKDQQLALLKTKAAIYHPSALRNQFAAFTLLKNELVNGEEAYVVKAALPDGGSDTLYFDAASGLLVRIRAETRASLGLLPKQIDLGDYRTVAGVKLPFEYDDSASDFSSADRISGATQYAPVRPDLFDKPSKLLKGFPQ